MTNQQQIEPSLVSTVVGASNRDLPSMELLTAFKDGRHAMAKFFQIHTCAWKSGSREPNHATFWVICHPLARLIYTLPLLQNLTALASAIPEIWMGPQN